MKYCTEGVASRAGSLHRDLCARAEWETTSNNYSVDKCNGNLQPKNFLRLDTPFEPILKMSPSKAAHFLQIFILFFIRLHL